MGSTSSKFRKALHVGDEKVAEELYHGSVEFQKVFDPNSSYGENYNHNTALHYASRHGMHRLVRIFIQRHNGNPNKRNSDNQTSLHCICMEEQIRPPSSTYSYSQYYYSQPPEKKRLECARLVLAWRGIAMGEGEREQIHIDAEDEDGNTALHYAAGSGYLSIVEMLLEHNASMFVDNADKETPCDCAERHQHIDIAQLLESKMVFSSPSNEEEPPEEVGAMLYEEAYTGLRHQELQEAKDLVVVETADMLRVPLFTAEALLRNFEWSRESLLESWIQNPEECCEKCGVKPPENLDSFVEEHKLSSLEPRPVTQQQEEPLMCDICTSTVPADEMSSDTLCVHQFCRDCWERYLNGKIKEGNAHSIVCPGYDCDRLVPVEAIEKLVSREMSKRYLQFDINAFVESNPKLKWCPVAGCGRAVQMPQQDPSTPFSASGSNRPSGASSPSTPPSISHAVDCGQGHIFCWDCSGDAHEPCCCENWKKWLDKIAEIKPEELASTDNETELAANCLWLVTNSKPCPKCMAPIQKNDGCNHMKCTKCKHDFCWVCQEAWSKHSSETGGYFRCNRFEVVSKVDEKAESLLTDAEKKHREMQELNRFIHFYTRFKNHGHSHSLEEPLLRKAVVKMRKLASRSGPKGLEATKFIEESIHELLKARRVLRFSYPYGYYLEDRGGSKQIFEFMQNELEESTETLSQMVARPYLRTPRHKIVQTAQLVLRKRQEFLSAVSKGLLPPDTPPRLPRRPSNLHQSSWDSDSDEEDEAFRQAIEASLQEAVAQAESSTDQQQEESPLAFLDLHLNPNRKRHSSGSRDPGSMTEGLLRALEMSQLLLMQQTEQLQPRVPGTATTAATSSNATAAASNSGTSAGSSTGTAAHVTGSKTTKASSQSSQGLSGQSAESGAPSSFDDDFQKAIQLSLQELEGGLDADAGQSHKHPGFKLLRDSADSQGSSRTSGSSKSRRKKISAKEHRSTKESSRLSKASLSGDEPVGLLDLSKELESEFERIKRKTLSPDEDIPAYEDKEEVLKNPWERKSDQRKGATSKTSKTVYPYKASASNVKKNSGSPISKSNLLSAPSRRIPDEAHGTSSKTQGSAISLGSDDAVRAVRASSDPYAPAIKSLLTHLESQRAVSAEHVSRARTQQSKARTSKDSSGSSTPTHSDSSDAGKSSSSLLSTSPKTSNASKPVWLEGPLLAKSRPRKTVDMSSKLPVKSALPIKLASTNTSKPSSLNIELYLSRKATPEEESRREKAANTSILSKSADNSDKVSASVHLVKEPNSGVIESLSESSSALDLTGGGVGGSGPSPAESISHSRPEKGTSEETTVTPKETLPMDELPLQVAKNEDAPLSNASLEASATVKKDSQPQDDSRSPAESSEPTGSGIDKGKVKSSQPTEPKEATSYIPSESPWEICQPELSLTRTTKNGGQSPGISKQKSVDKLSVRATVDKPIWERKETADGSTETPGAGGDATDTSPASCQGKPDESGASAALSTEGSSLQDLSSGDQIRPAATGSASSEASAGPVWECGEGRTTTSESDGSESQVWQMFI